MTKMIILMTLIFTVLSLQAKTTFRLEEENGYFSGRISKVNLEAGIVRVKLSFNNQKYLNKKDKVEFWDEHDPNKRCRSYIVGKTADYVLLKVPDADYCSRFVFMANGAYVKFYSQDLANNLKMGRELVDILLKKHMALKGKLNNTKKDLDSYMEKINALNARYQVLRDKLELEWRMELTSLEDDQTVSLQTYREVEKKIDEVNYKLEQYRIEDENFKVDRWALDPRQHYKK